MVLQNQMKAVSGGASPSPTGQRKPILYGLFSREEQAPPLPVGENDCRSLQEGKKRTVEDAGQTDRRGRRFLQRKTKGSEQRGKDLASIITASCISSTHSVAYPPPLGLHIITASSCISSTHSVAYHQPLGLYIITAASCI